MFIRSVELVMMGAIFPSAFVSSRPTSISPPGSKSASRTQLRRKSLIAPRVFFAGESGSALYHRRRLQQMHSAQDRYRLVELTVKVHVRTIFPTIARFKTGHRRQFGAEKMDRHEKDSLILPSAFSALAFEHVNQIAAQRIHNHSDDCEFLAATTGRVGLIFESTFGRQIFPWSPWSPPDKCGGVRRRRWQSQRR